MRVNNLLTVATPRHSVPSKKACTMATVLGRSPSGGRVLPGSASRVRC